MWRGATGGYRYWSWRVKQQDIFEGFHFQSGLQIMGGAQNGRLRSFKSYNSRENTWSRRNFRAHSGINLMRGVPHRPWRARPVAPSLNPHGEGNMPRLCESCSLHRSWFQAQFRMLMTGWKPGVFPLFFFPRSVGDTLTWEISWVSKSNVYGLISVVRLSAWSRRRRDS